MAVAFVTVGAIAANATTTTLNVVAPTFDDTDNKNILIAVILGKDNQTITAPSGFTKFVEVNNTANQRTTVAWKRAAPGDSGATKAFTKGTDNNLLFCGVIAIFSGCLTSATPIDASAPTTSANASSDTVTYADFNPTETDAYVVAVGTYNNDLTTAGSISGTNPTLTNRWDLETGTGSDGSLFGYSGSSDGSATGARSHSTTSTADDVNTGVLFGLVAEPPAASSPVIRLRTGQWVGDRVDPLDVKPQVFPFPYFEQPPPPANPVIAPRRTQPIVDIAPIVPAKHQGFPFFVAEAPPETFAFVAFRGSAVLVDLPERPRAGGFAAFPFFARSTQVVPFVRTQTPPALVLHVTAAFQRFPFAPARTQLVPVVQTRVVGASPTIVLARVQSFPFTTFQVVAPANPVIPIMTTRPQLIPATLLRTPLGYFVWVGPSPTPPEPEQVPRVIRNRGSAAFRRRR